MAEKKFALIAFCGVDGSGKTTLAEALSADLEKEGRPVGLKHGHGYSASKDTFGFGEKGVNRYRLLFRLLLPFAYLDNLFTFYFKYRPLLKEKTLICDRYFYDKLARLIFYEICPLALAKVYLQLLPRPDHVFFLDIEASDARNRKEGYTEEALESFRRAYLFIASCLNAPVINTSFSAQDCLRKIKEALEKER